MEALGVSPWLLWALVGFGPSIFVLYFGVRALRRDTGTAWWDRRDVGVLTYWITPGLVVLAALSLSRIRLTPLALGVYSAIPMLTYIAADSITSRLSKHWRNVDTTFLTSVRMFIAQSAGGIAITVFLFLRALAAPETVGRMPGWSLFMWVFGASLAGALILGRLGTGVGEWKPLAPGELYRRVVEIAAKLKVEVDAVRILTDYPWDYVGAFANSGSSIGFGEELITRLNKNEVDAVIAHEVGHCADDIYWKWSYPASIVLFIAWIGAVSYLEGTIGSLPDQFHSLQYANWMAMCITPGLVRRAYSRYSERKADSKVAVLDNPLAAISGYYKLHLLNDLPVTRPWWSRMLSTHPTLREDIETIARRSGLTTEQVDEARRRAETEAESGPSDRYEIVFHEEAESEIESRGSHAVEVSITVGAVLLGCVVFFGFFALAAAMEMEGWKLACMLIGGAVVTAGVIILPIHIHRVRQDHRLRGRIRSKLARKYGDEAISSMLLVDARINQDEDVWQGALIGSRDGKLIVLTELREVAVPLDARLSVERFAEDGTIGEEARMVAIWYEVDSVRQWIVVRNLGKPGKGLPRSAKDLERHVRDLITGEGGAIRERGKVPIRQVLVRAPIALLALTATAGLIQLLAPLADFKDTFVIHWIVLLSVGSPLYAWVAKRPRSDESDT